jgi:CubicO group peptidase (beta-lactamase class C family)
MPGYRGRSRPLVLAVLAVVSCLLIGCTGRSQPTDPSSAGSPLSTVPASPSPSASRVPDYVAMKRDLQQRLAGGDLSLGAVRAVLVSVDGETALSYYRDRRPADYAHVWSVTKSVMSILVGIAIDEGRLRLDQTLAELLPAHADEMTDEIKSVTLRQLLTMTAGIQGGRPLVDTSADDLIGDFVSAALVSEPGTAFLYSNASAHLVGAVLRVAVDRPLLDYAREKLFDPLGIDTRPAWQGWDIETGLRKPGFGWGTDREGTNSGCCLLKLTAPDMLKIGQLYLDGGRWQGRRIVSSQWVKESTTNQLTTEQATSEGPYGYLWRTGHIESHPYFAAAGSYGQWIIVVPDSRLIVVTACDESGFDPPTEEFVNTFNDVIIKPIIQT